MTRNSPLIGSHVSFKAPDYFLGSIEEAISYEANACMIYLGAPQTTKRVIGVDFMKDEALKLMLENGFDPHNVIVHAPYIVNLANPDKEKQEFAKAFLRSEIERSLALDLHQMVLHPGSALDQPLDEAIARVATSLKEVLSDYPSMTILLETMAGKGSEIGKNFSEISQLLTQIALPNVAICLDTCHLNDAGYDLKDFEALKSEMKLFFPLEKVRCIHLNDSKNERAAHKDRHANIGSGTIGFKVLQDILYDEDFKDIPKILETPYIDGIAPYKEEIALLKSR